MQGDAPGSFRGMHICERGLSYTETLGPLIDFELS
jgi:hypothetical protein